MEDKKPQPERDQTDASLRTERTNTDQAITEALVGTEHDADDLVARARENADAAVAVARDRADRRSAASEARPHMQSHEALVKERSQRDDALRDERATADETLRVEREEQGRILAALLPLEREKTDRYLLTERARSDFALASRDNFLAIVSHDLRNLLSGIVLTAHMLAETGRDADDGHRKAVGAKRIQRYAARMNRLIGDLGDVVSLDAGKLSVLSERADAVSLLGEAVATFAPAASEKGISLSSESLESSLPAFFDHDRLFQVLANLITNALKFTPKGGSIRVHAERAKGDLHISVSDTGCGVPSELLESVFARFWQVGANDRRGLGLGLYIARGIVEAHGGRIWAESNGNGSVFQLTIPLSPASATPPASAPAT